MAVLNAGKLALCAWPIALARGNVCVCLLSLWKSNLNEVFCVGEDEGILLVVVAGHTFRCFEADAEDAQTPA